MAITIYIYTPNSFKKKSTMTGHSAEAAAAAAKKLWKKQKQIENIIYNILPCLIWVVGFHF